MLADHAMPVDLILVRHGESEGQIYDSIGAAARQLGRMDEARAMQARLHGRHSSEWRLTDLGRVQARRTGKVIQNLVLTEIGCFDKCYCSTFVRAIETAGHMSIPHSRFSPNIFLREKDSKSEWRKAGLQGAFTSKSFSNLNFDGAKSESKSKASLFTDGISTSKMPSTTTHSKPIEPIGDLDPRSAMYRSQGDMAESSVDLLIRVKLFIQDLQHQCSGQRVLLVCHRHIMKAFEIILTDVPPDRYASVWSKETPKCCIDWYTRRDSEDYLHSQYVRHITLSLKEVDRLDVEHIDVHRKELDMGEGRGDLSTEDLDRIVHESEQKLNTPHVAVLLGKPRQPLQL